MKNLKTSGNFIIWGLIILVFLAAIVLTIFAISIKYGLIAVVLYFISSFVYGSIISRIKESK